MLALIALAIKASKVRDTKSVNNTRAGCCKKRLPLGPVNRIGKPRPKMVPVDMATRVSEIENAENPSFRSHPTPLILFWKALRDRKINVEAARLNIQRKICLVPNRSQAENARFTSSGNSGFVAYWSRRDSSNNGLVLTMSR